VSVQLVGMIEPPAGRQLVDDDDQSDSPTGQAPKPADEEGEDEESRHIIFAPTPDLAHSYHLASCDVLPPPPAAINL
jgi:hypothetical protein